MNANTLSEKAMKRQSNMLRVYKFNASLFRKKRFQKFVDLCMPELTDTMLDVGGTVDFWSGKKQFCKKIDLLNIRHIQMPQSLSNIHTQIDLVKGDARCLMYNDSSYDIVFSNSVIEHVGSWEDQVSFANECRRVGKKLWIQTPAKSFFIEPHFMTLFVHWLPKKFQKYLVRYFSLWGLLNRPTAESVSKMVDEIRLISFDEMRILFPDCKIHRERVAFVFVKSYIAYRA